MTHCRTIPLWNLALAEARGGVRWQTFNRALFLVTRAGRVYRAKKVFSGFALSERK